MRHHHDKSQISIHISDPHHQERHLQQTLITDQWQSPVEVELATDWHTL